jgi:hypothetical protein
MLWISHRGNLHGPDKTNENKIDYIDHVLDTTTFDVEIDVHGVDATLYLGHDEPQEMIPLNYLKHPRLWFHCKNASALQYMSAYGNAKYFWHEDDDYTLTSNGKVWVYPGAQLLKGSIAVLPEIAYDGHLETCYGICTDYIYKFIQEVMNA